MSAHFAQMCYLGLVAAAAMAPVHFSPLRVYHAARQFRKSHAWVLALGGCAAAFVAVHFFRSAYYLPLQTNPFD